METILLLLGVWGFILLLIVKDYKKDRSIRNQYCADIESKSLDFEESSDIYIRQEGYNRYEGIDYRGDKP